MSSKRKLYPCAKSDNFELLEVTSGSETESATEECIMINPSEERPLKKRKVNANYSGCVEVICIESGAVERKLEIVPAPDKCKSAVNLKNAVKYQVDVADSDEEIQFITEVQTHVAKKSTVKTLGELAAAKCTFPSVGAENKTNSDQEIQFVSLDGKAHVQKMCGSDDVKTAKQTATKETTDVIVLDEITHHKLKGDHANTIDLTDCVECASQDSALQFEMGPLYQNQLQDENVLAEYDAYWNDLE